MLESLMFHKNRYMKLKFLVFSVLFLGVVYSSSAQTRFSNRKMLSLMNLARADGKKFLDSIVYPYLKENNIEKTSYVRSLISTLKKTKGVQPLKLDKELNQTAKAWAVESGKRGEKGHRNIKKRLYKLNRGSMAENCTYGADSDLEAIMDLLIDEGIRSLGHRKSILNPTYKFIGMGSSTHKVYGTCVVQNFASR